MFLITTTKRLRIPRVNYNQNYYMNLTKERKDIINPKELLLLRKIPVKGNVSSQN